MTDGNKKEQKGQNNCGKVDFVQDELVDILNVSLRKRLLKNYVWNTAL